MLGGAVGAAASQLGGLLACQVTVGFLIGLITSVILFLPLIAIVRIVELFVIHKDTEGLAAGGLAPDKLAGLLGGLAGSAGAVVVAALPDDANLFDAPVSVMCWTVVTLVAIGLSLALVRYGQAYHWFK